MEFSFDGEVIHWRGPAPWYFVRLAADAGDWIEEHAAELTYGWGCIPVRAVIGVTGFETSLFPKDGGYLLPLKATVRKAERIEEGGSVSVRLLAG